MKKYFGLILSLFFISAVSAWGKPRGEVTILYTNDVHTYIANTVKDKEGKKVPGLSYGSIVALRDDLKAQGKEVALVDAGDHIQGTAYGAMDKGAGIVKIMNAAKYDAATIGNHEFDYGTKRLFEIIKEAKYPYLSCNFLLAKNNKPVTDAYKILKFGKTKVAFIGIMTPETYTKSTPVYFMDEARTKFIYKIGAGDDGKELYSMVQKAIDAVSKKADYIVALGHLGDDPASSPWTSVDVIENTHGLDAFIDAHSHSTVPEKFVKDSSGKDVLLSQTGYYFAAIGKLTLSDKGASSELIKSYDRSDEKISAIVKDLVSTVDGKLNEEIALSDVPLYINEPENPKSRLIRKQETNLGDLVADAAYYYFNEVEQLKCDMSIANGGGIRADLPAGSYSYNSAKKVQPFGNVMCLVELTGQEILDALEFGARNVGTGENGGFLHVAGIKFTIDTSIPNTIKTSAEGLWTSAPTEYRVRDIQVYNKETASYEPIDLAKTYTLGGMNYTLRNMGDGFAMLANTKLVKDYVSEDYLMTSAYVKSFAKGEDGITHISTANSPLSSYKNYLLDYENPNGSGRITIK
ncbi:bifunctional metallophosphatase/5'-nucleotidase [Treponema ruminis]|uniref:2',3'-cyclic-nucleotide 2'-phosphodiesterase (5'-nucleotidase family) n=1 Tax=Treponema ruminis TaxID=744515 RepID=A0A7W8GA15_9SPIR|nr:bifunctional UDP-sugar hydrolase/5'-nucleotidase [Treponema ruminis]MBB5226469.1 2',3'-cyclic-nucleotide 2'-phosphodiesterase (5'-nucleotidase family) [Treponema ruminis]QSI02626.1 bifunctional metallophosphatase/5'-nucleotidase [Treponema ruminis]